jgi:hypothetical protein
VHSSAFSISFEGLNLLIFHKIAGLSWAALEFDSLSSSENASRFRFPEKLLSPVIDDWTID